MKFCFVLIILSQGTPFIFARRRGRRGGRRHSNAWVAPVVMGTALTAAAIASSNRPKDSGDARGWREYANRLEEETKDLKEELRRERRDKDYLKDRVRKLEDELRDLKG